MPHTPRRPLLCFFVLLIVVCSPLQAAGDSALDRIVERGTLVLGTSGNMPSMSQAEEGRISGFDIDLARVMANLMGVKLEVSVMPFGELLPALQAGTVDVVISNMTITPQRNLKVAFVGPYMVSGKCVVSKDRALAEAEQGSTDLNTAATRLAVLADSTSQDFAGELFPKATIVPIDDYARAAEMVKNDEVSGLLTDYPICLATLKANPDAGFVSVFSLLTYEPIGIALPKGDAQFMNWTANFLDRLDGTNGIQELGRRWFGKVKLDR